MFRPNLPGDIFGGITSAVVMLPMALAFGVASGLGPVAGLYGAVAVGFFAAVFGGTSSLISGPTGPMTVAMAVVVTLYADNLAIAFTIVMLAGLLQIALGTLRIGSFVGYTPYTVISGFMSGIGLIIILLQIMPTMGLELAPGGPLGQLIAIPDAISELNNHSLILCAISLGICVFWPDRIRRFMPPALTALIVGTLIGLFWLTDAPVIGEIPVEMPTFWMPEFRLELAARIIEPALIIALLGSIDSLLSSLVADSLTRTRHRPNKELIAQGLGNLAAGILGALPGAGATMGTVTNIRAGGRSALAGALAAVILLALLLGFGWVAEPIPYAVLAGILIKVGWDIIDKRFITRVFVVRREYVLVMLLTFFITVFVDLITAVALGLIASGVVRSQDLRRRELDSVISTPLIDPIFFPESDDFANLDPMQMPVGIIKLTGRFSVGSANDLTLAVSDDIQDHHIVIMDFSGTTEVDDSAALAIEQIIQTALDQDTVCIIFGLSEEVSTLLNSLMIFHRVPEEYFVSNLNEAKQLSKRILDERYGE